MIEPTITLQTEDLPTAHLMKIQGNLDVTNSHAIEKEFMTWIESANRKLVIDLNGVAFMSSAGLRVILNGFKLAGEKGIGIALFGLNPAVEKVFDIVGLTQLFSLHKDLNSAIA